MVPELLRPSSWMILKFSKSFFIINENPPKLGGFFCFKAKFKLKKFAIKAGNF